MAQTHGSAGRHVAFDAPLSGRIEIDYCIVWKLFDIYILAYSCHALPWVDTGPMPYTPLTGVCFRIRCA